MIILASASPSRKAVLEAAGIKPRIIAASIDESSIIHSLQDKSPEDIVEALAHAKAKKVFEQYSNDFMEEDFIIGCDSMLLINGVLQGKPHTIERMLDNWKEQSGAQASLLSGHCVIRGDGEYITKTSVTDIQFASPTEEDIRAYAQTGEALECAGSFTLEGRGGWFIDSIHGDPSGVLGISLPLLRSIFYSFNKDIHSLW